MEYDTMRVGLMLSISNVEPGTGCRLSNVVSMKGMRDYGRERCIAVVRRIPESIELER